jgi:hypothetical protein
MTTGCSNRSSSKAAAEVKAAGVAIPPAHPKRAKTCSFPWGYVDDFEEARTNEW